MNMPDRKKLRRKAEKKILRILRKLERDAIVGVSGVAVLRMTDENGKKVVGEIAVDIE